MTEKAVAPTGSDDTTLSTRLLALSREAHGRGYHEAAYHALTASMHAADDQHDVRMLGVIRHEAETQIGDIDRTAPSHRLSSKSASRHGHPGVYAMLTRQATMHIRMHDANDLPGRRTARERVHGSPRKAESPSDPADER